MPDTKTLKSALNDFIVGLRHIGFVVDDLDAAVASFNRVYGLPMDAVRWIPDPHTDDVRARFAFLTVGGSEIELVQPVDKESRSMLSSPPSGSAGINHVAWQVSDLDACMQILGQQGIGPGHVTPDGPAEFKHLSLVYLDPDACGGQLIELIETHDS